MSDTQLRAVDNLIFENEATGANIEIPGGTVVELLEGERVAVDVETGKRIVYVDIVFNGEVIDAPRSWFDRTH